MEARPPAENRHGGAPRGERPASWDAPHPAGCGSVAPHPRDTRDKCACRRSAHPSIGDGREHKDRPGRKNAPRERTTTALFDIVSMDTANGSLCAPRLRTRLCDAPSLSCPGRASVSERRAGTQGLHGKIDGQLKRPVVSPWVPGLASLARDTRSVPDLAQMRSLHSPGTRDRRTTTDTASHAVRGGERERPRASQDAARRSYRRHGLSTISLRRNSSVGAISAMMSTSCPSSGIGPL